MDQLLSPGRTNVTVLFCDLRGSCRLAEEEQDLQAICDRVTEALRLMTDNIVREDGVIADFQGDAAMGFWGWPEETSDQVEHAARAALGILKAFHQARRLRSHPLAAFGCGIGIAHGPGLAGRLGTLDQFKVGAFGPVVNLAARLESLTKSFGCSILLDEQAAAKLADRPFRLRRLAKTQPFGMSRALMVHELLPPSHEAGAMAERDRLDYEAALDNFLAGRWDLALGLLDRLPLDKSAEFLKQRIRQLEAPPADWNGVVVMESK
jgi:adenylate cyclase